MLLFHLFDHFSQNYLEILNEVDCCKLPIRLITVDTKIMFKYYWVLERKHAIKFLSLVRQLHEIYEKFEFFAHHNSTILPDVFEKAKQGHTCILIFAPLLAMSTCSFHLIEMTFNRRRLTSYLTKQLKVQSIYFVCSRNRSLFY